MTVVAVPTGAQPNILAVGQFVLGHKAGWAQEGPGQPVP